MRVFKTPSFARWAIDERLDDIVLVQAVREMEHGLLGSSLGTSVYKKRIRLHGKGKSGGARTIVAYRHGQVAVFLFGFSKDERGNITKRELSALRKHASQYLGYSEEGWNLALRKGAVWEVEYHGKENTTEKSSKQDS